MDTSRARTSSGAARNVGARPFDLDVCPQEQHLSHICFVLSGRILKILQKPVDQVVFIGVAAPHAIPNRFDRTDQVYSSCGIDSFGVIRVAGQALGGGMPAASITQPALYKKRGLNDRVFSAGDEVTVTVDSASRKVRLQSATVDYTIDSGKIEPQEWVLNVNFAGGDFQVQYVRSK